MATSKQNKVASPNLADWSGPQCSLTHLTVRDVQLTVNTSLAGLTLATALDLTTMNRVRSKNFWKKNYKDQRECTAAAKAWLENEFCKTETKVV